MPSDSEVKITFYTKNLEDMYPNVSASSTEVIFSIIQNQLDPTFNGWIKVILDNHFNFEVANYFYVQDQQIHKTDGPGSLYVLDLPDKKTVYRYFILQNKYLHFEEWLSKLNKKERIKALFHFDEWKNDHEIEIKKDNIP